MPIAGRFLLFMFSFSLPSSLFLTVDQSLVRHSAAQALEHQPPSTTTAVCFICWLRGRGLDPDRPDCGLPRWAWPGPEKHKGHKNSWGQPSQNSNTVAVLTWSSSRPQQDRCVVCVRKACDSTDVLRTDLFRTELDTVIEYAVANACPLSNFESSMGLAGLEQT